MKIPDHTEKLAGIKRRHAEVMAAAEAARSTPAVPSNPRLHEIKSRIDHHSPPYLRFLTDNYGKAVGTVWHRPGRGGWRAEVDGAVIVAEQVEQLRDLVLAPVRRAVERAEEVERQLAEHAARGWRIDDCTAQDYRCRDLVIRATSRSDLARRIGSIERGRER